MARRERGKPLRYPPPATCFSLPSSKRGGRTPTDADLTAALAHGARSAERARLSAFHHGSHLREYSSQRLGFRPGFLGRGLNGRYPPSPVPVQGCTSHPGHHAGRLIPKPPGSGLQIRPRAPHPLHLTACLRKASLGERDFRARNLSRDYCQEPVSFILTKYDYKPINCILEDKNDSPGLASQ